jgi:hypothetical protein
MSWAVIDPRKDLKDEGLSSLLHKVHSSGKMKKTARKSSKIRNFRKFKDNCLSGSKRKNILILSEVHLALGNTSRMHVLGGTGSGEIGAPYL